MNKGIQFDMRVRHVGDKSLSPCPPFNCSGQFIFGSYKESGYASPIVAVMHDYYSVSAEEQRRMVENTIALCEMKYQEQSLNQ